MPDPPSVDRIADVLSVDLDLVLALAGHRPPDAPLNPDDPGEQIAALAKRVRWNKERFETVEAILVRYIEFDREDASQSSKAD